MSGSQVFAPLMGLRHGMPRRAGKAIRRAWNLVWVALEVVASRRYLLEMDDRMLQDIGISRAQANFEASRKPWQIRAHHRR